MSLTETLTLIIKKTLTTFYHSNEEKTLPDQQKPMTMTNDKNYKYENMTQITQVTHMTYMTNMTNITNMANMTT